MTPETKELLKKKGLKAAEDHMILGLDECIEIGELMVADTENSFDDTALMVIKTFKAQIKEFIDKLDGEDNQN